MHCRSRVRTRAGLPTKAVDVLLHCSFRRVVTIVTLCHVHLHAAPAALTKLCNS